MASKKFKNKPCVYCGELNASETADHIFAKRFFLPHQSNNLPKAPACQICNNKKSNLEKYLTAILPFGAMHTDAAINLGTMVQKRLDKNVPLQRQLSEGLKKEWCIKKGILFPQMTLPIDNHKLNELFRYITKGLIWYHWEVILTLEHFVDAGTLTISEENIFCNMFNMNTKKRVSIDLADGTFKYEGVQGIDCPQISLWKFTIYGGLKLCGDPQNPNEYPTYVLGFTSRNTEVVNTNKIF
jgi:hypothetical protein